MKPIEDQFAPNEDKIEPVREALLRFAPAGWKLPFNRATDPLPWNWDLIDLCCFPLSGGVASNTTAINNIFSSGGGGVIISSGGSAISTTLLSAGVELVFSGGAANSTFVDGTTAVSGHFAQLQVNSGGIGEVVGNLLAAMALPAVDPI